MSAKNNGILIGNLASEPEAGSGAGVSRARFRIAVDSYNASTKTREPDFIPIVAFGKTAEFALKYLHKGGGAVIRFHVKPRSWGDPTTGEKKYETAIIADEIEFAPGGKREEPSVGYMREDLDPADDLRF